MVTWGMVGNSHDASMACFIDDRPVWACMAKDFEHAKMRDHHPDFHWTMIEVANQSYGRPDKIVWYEKPLWKTTRQWWAGQGWLAKENNIKKRKGKKNGQKLNFIYIYICYIDRL